MRSSLEIVRAFRINGAVLSHFMGASYSGNNSNAVNQMDTNWVQRNILCKRNYCEKTTACWSCHKSVVERDTFFCSNCGKLLQAKSDYNYFKLLSLENKFDINASDLTKQFRRLQNSVHPDKYCNKEENEKQYSEEWSSILNKAYKVLSTPLDRGEYILRLRGIELPKDNSSLNKEFLMEMMEKNEEVEDATEDNILTLLHRTRSECDKLSDQLKDLLNNEKNDEAKNVLVKMKYYKSLEKSIKEKSIKLGKVE